MNAEEIIGLLNQEPEMNPDAHDGSYELMREIVAAYSKLADYSSINFKDLNAVYAMAIGTWKLNVEKKKEYVHAGHLPQEQKERMTNVIDNVWNNACYERYSNRENRGPSIGMFGTGFYSFENKADAKSCQRFIKMLVDIASLDDDNLIFDVCSKVFDSNFNGMQAASASVMLHCLKPYTFPILNANFGDGTVYGPLGIKLEKPGRITTYIDNCRRIKKFRDEKLSVKNYRILDRFPRKYHLSNLDKYTPTLEEYDPEITTEKYIEIFRNNKKSLDTVYYIYDIGGEATCSTLATKYGNTAQHYNSNATYLSKIIHNITKCPLNKREDDSGNWYWPILFQGRYTERGEQGIFSWKLRQPVFDAISELADEGFFDDLIPEEKENMKTTISKNTILYGPPGTGKTYNTVIYSVAIIENKSVEEVSEEAMTDYSGLKARYDQYKKDDRVAFVTFHQSYGYEEFIEGIKPVVDNGDQDESSLEYTIEPGVFKRFCERAAIPKKQKNKDFGLNASPTVWKVSLQGTGENPTRRECLNNGHIRIGWDEYGPEITESTVNDDVYFGGIAPLNAFINKMKIGDIVLSCYSSTQIDAIGIVTGDYVFDESFDYYKRVRNVKWLAKDIREDIVELNGGRTLTLSTVYKLNIPARDVLDIVSKYQNDTDVSLESSDENYVFVIDEINRGNISKIFGELITLIEENKRLGAKEESTVKLPYSASLFGVPNNIYILGTMNTADRSIAIMDTALRRRFSFEEMLPDSNVLRELGDPVIYQDGISVNVANMLDIINERITFLFDREHTIGHAFFIPLIDDPSIGTLAKIFEKSIIPLLQEYFYEDYAKIQLVLGDDGKTGDKKQYQFIFDEDMEANKIFETVQELDSEKKYSINYPAFQKIESYKYISKRL